MTRRETPPKPVKTHFLSKTSDGITVCGLVTEPRPENTLTRNYGWARRWAKSTTTDPAQVTCKRCLTAYHYKWAKFNMNQLELPLTGAISD